MHTVCKQNWATWHVVQRFRGNLPILGQNCFVILYYCASGGQNNRIVQPYKKQRTNMSVLTSSPSTNGESADGQPNEQKKAKVCLCCGSYTIFAVSIREPTHGLNMMDVIMEKFNRQPCDDDRYLCYSCNNWLIDWFTRRKQSDNEDAPDTTTPIGADTSGRCIQHIIDTNISYSLRTECERSCAVSFIARSKGSAS